MIDNLLSIDSHDKIYAILGGVIPALIWLFFWLREDSKRPEPKGRILTTFLLGMISVVFVVPFQQAALLLFPSIGSMIYLIWATLEEGFKFGAASLGGLRSRDNNEPVDALIYMITAALGFSALENALFLLEPIIQTNIPGGLMTGGLRFIGATLLHTLSTGVIGIALAFSFNKPRRKQIINISMAFVLAVAIHTFFNLFLVYGNNLGTPIAFAAVWAGVSVLLLFFERIKALRGRRIDI